jgi:hypothetical protein
MQRFSESTWVGFEITSPSGVGGILLEQVESRKFRLGSDITYTGETGLDLDDDAAARLRNVSPTTLVETDLASVPGPFRWWADSYGMHTPAALIHDRFIGDPIDGQPGRPPGVTEQHIDRYFRFMLRGLGIPYLRSWLMWAAVASRTRLKSGPRKALSLFVWLVASTLGITLFVTSLLDQDTGSLIVSLVLPLVFSVLWGRQAGAGIIIAYVGVPFLLLPSLFAIPFLFLYAIAEAIANQIIEARQGYDDGPAVTNA